MSLQKEILMRLTKTIALFCLVVMLFSCAGVDKAAKKGEEKIPKIEYKVTDAFHLKTLPIKMRHLRL